MFSELKQPELWNLYEKLVNAEFKMEETYDDQPVLYSEVMTIQYEVLEELILRMDQDGRILRP